MTRDIQQQNYAQLMMAKFDHRLDLNSQTTPHISFFWASHGIQFWLPDKKDCKNIGTHHEISEVEGIRFFYAQSRKHQMCIAHMLPTVLVKEIVRHYWRSGHTMRNFHVTLWTSFKSFNSIIGILSVCYYAVSQKHETIFQSVAHSMFRQLVG